MSDKPSTPVGTVTVILKVGSLETGHPEVPDYLEVTGAQFVSTTLSDDQINQLLADNKEEGVIGFENAEVDVAIENFRDGYQPTDPRIELLAEMIRGNFLPTMPKGSLNGDAERWLKKLDAAEWPSI